MDERSSSPDSRQNRVPQQILLPCLVFALCLLTAELGGILKVYVPQPVWLLWPGCAMLAAILLVVRRRFWPILIVSGLLGFVLYDVQSSLDPALIARLLAADIAEILTVVLGVSLMFNGQPQLNSFRNLMKYGAFAVMLAPIVAATIGAATMRGNYWISWRIIWFSEALAFLTLPSAIWGWLYQLRKWRDKPPRYWTEAFLLILGVSLLGYVISVTSTHSLLPTLFYALVPFLIWAALRFGSLGVSTSIIIIAFQAIWGAIHGRGPFTAATPLEGGLALQAFLLCAAVPFTVLAALAEQHAHVEQELLELGGRLIKAQEEERTRIARELHDDLSQKMARLLMHLKRCQHNLADISPKYGAQLNLVEEMASEVSATLRDLSHLLHPATLTTLGLETSIAGFCREFSEQHNLSVKFVCRDIPKESSEDVSLGLFRIVQEALGNVLKHSAAQEARVTLTGIPDRIDLSIEDSGIGFDPRSSDGKAGLGLVSMRERVRLMRGLILIESAPSKGTRVRVQVPVEKGTSER